LLDAMRWHADMVVTNDFDERVWLKPLIVDGKRIGITDCCFETNPCPRHREMANAPRQPEPASGDRLHADVGTFGKTTRKENGNG